VKSLSEQFAVVLRVYPDATLTADSGVHRVVLPRIRLPSGWSQEATHVRFVVPNGYPYAAPDCFWADATLRLANGALPQNAQIGGNLTPGQTDATLLWFSWHIQASAWVPTRSDLMTYVHVIRRRFEEKV
jgi:E2/UBC family protein E